MRWPSTDFLQGIRDARRVASELDGRRVREEFSLPGNGGLDPIGKEDADVANHRESSPHQSQPHQDSNRPFVVIGVAP